MKKKLIEEDDMEEGEFEEDVYTEKGREELLEDDEISDVEDGIVKGFEEDEKMTMCANCRKILVNEDFVEKEIDDMIYRFCCDECAEEYVRSMKKGKE